MKDISSVCVMSYPGERFQQEQDRNLDINSIAHLDGTDTTMGQLGDLTNPVGATIMDWTERLIELTLSTDEVTVGTESHQPSSTATLSTSENMCRPTPSSGVTEIVTSTAQEVEIQGNFVLQDTEMLSNVEHEQQDLYDNVNVTSTFSFSSAPRSSVTFSVSNTSSDLNVDMLDKSELILSSWAAENLSCNNEPIMTTASTMSSIDTAIFTAQDHQYSSPMRENVTFLSQTTRQTLSQSGSFDESYIDTPSSLLSVGTSAGSWSDTIDLENATPSVVSSTSLYSPSQTIPISTVFSPQNCDTSAISSRASTENYQLYDTTTNQAASSGELTDNILDSLGEDVNQTILDATDAFIDFATVEVGPPECSASTSIVEVDSHQADQTLQDPLQLPASYSGTVTICRADEIPFSMRTENSTVFQAPSTTDEARYSSANPCNTSEQSYYDLDTLIPQALRSCLGISDTVDDLSLEVSPANHQGSEQNSQHQSTNLWSSDLYIFPDEERDQGTFSSVENTETSMSTQEEISCSSRHPDIEKFVLSCDASMTPSGAYSLLKQKRPSISISEGSSQQRIPKPIASNLKAIPRQSALKISLLQPSTSLCASPIKQSQRSHLVSSSNPPPSELSTDALLSPSDVYRTFLPASDSLKVSTSNASSSSRTRTISDASDISMTDSDISGSFSAPSVASLAELDKSESLPTGNKLKDTLRSRLKAKRRAAGLSEEVQQIRSGKSLSSSASHFTSVSVSDLQSSSHNTRSSHRLQVSPSTSHSYDAGKWSKLKVLKDKSTDHDNSDDDYDINDDDDDSHDDSDDDDSSQSTATIDTKTSTRKRKADQPEEDEETRLAKREKNRLAARKCRHKKVTKIETLTAQVQRLEEKQTRIKTEVDRLEMEREQLQEMLRLHSLICPSKGRGKRTK